METLTEDERGRFAEGGALDSHQAKALRIIDALEQRVADLESVDERGLMAARISELEAQAEAAERETAALRVELKNARGCENELRDQSIQFDAELGQATRELAAANALLREATTFIPEALWPVWKRSEARHLAHLSGQPAAPSEPTLPKGLRTLDVGTRNAVEVLRNPPELAPAAPKSEPWFVGKVLGMPQEVPQPATPATCGVCGTTRPAAGVCMACHPAAPGSVLRDGTWLRTPEEERGQPAAPGECVSGYVGANGECNDCGERHAAAPRLPPRTIPEEALVPVGVTAADHEAALSEAYDRGMRDALAALGLEPDAD